MNEREQAVYDAITDKEKQRQTSVPLPLDILTLEECRAVWARQGWRETVNGEDVVRFTLRLPKKLNDDLNAIATRERRTRQDTIILLLEASVILLLEASVREDKERHDADS